MSRFRRFPLFASLAVLAVGSTPAWAQHHGGNGGGRNWSLPQVRIESSLPQPPGPQGMREPRNGPSMETGFRSRPGAGDCGRSMALSPGDQVLAVQPVDFGGRVQCRIKVMGADGMVRVMMVSPGF